MELTRVLLGMVLCLSACAKELVTPIPTATYPGASEPARTLVVMLPGAGDRVGDFDEHGFIAAMRDSGMNVDMLEVDAHWGYYKSRTLLDRMEQDVLAPNRDKYEEIWLVGISLGGFGAVLTARAYPDDIDGIILLAPYLGPRRTVVAINQAGGLERWQPPAEVDDARWDVENWRMLKNACAVEGTGKPAVYLMYGEDDFGVRAHSLLAAALPSSRVRTIEGGHAWTVWEKLWFALMTDQALRAELGN
jgi:pimeloyl-ACP methyl ester carboxylesterase